MVFKSYKYTVSNLYILRKDFNVTHFSLISRRVYLYPEKTRPWRKSKISDTVMRWFLHIPSFRDILKPFIRKYEFETYYYHFCFLCWCFEAIWIFQISWPRKVRKDWNKKSPGQKYQTSDDQKKSKTDAPDCKYWVNGKTRCSDGSDVKT